MDIVGSCNGMVSVHGVIGGKPALTLWNPATKQFRYLELSGDSAASIPLSFIGFGFVSDTCDYKVVEFQFHFRKRIGGGITIPVLVYILSLDSWKSVEVAVPDLCFSDRAVAVTSFLH